MEKYQSLATFFAVDNHFTVTKLSHSVAILFLAVVAVAIAVVVAVVILTLLIFMHQLQLMLKHSNLSLRDKTFFKKKGEQTENSHPFLRPHRFSWPWSAQIRSWSRWWRSPSSRSSLSATFPSLPLHFQTFAVGTSPPGWRSSPSRRSTLICLTSTLYSGPFSLFHPLIRGSFLLLRYLRLHMCGLLNARAEFAHVSVCLPPFRASLSLLSVRKCQKFTGSGARCSTTVCT